MADAAGTPLIDVRGDLHVGQVLRHPDAPTGRGPTAGTPASYAVVDFDGNPVLAAAERVRRRPAAVDVAGMMASPDHVGRVVLHRGPVLARCLPPLCLREASRSKSGRDAAAGPRPERAQPHTPLTTTIGDISAQGLS